jgi:tRNA-dihydrouridine synthase
MGVRIARKHVTWYMQNNHCLDSTATREHRRAFNALECTEEQLNFINHYFQNSFNEVLAA